MRNGCMRRFWQALFLPNLSPKRIQKDCVDAVDTINNSIAATLIPVIQPLGGKGSLP